MEYLKIYVELENVIRISLITQEEHPWSSFSSKEFVFQLQGMYETLKGQNGTQKFCFHDTVFFAK